MSYGQEVVSIFAEHKQECWYQSLCFISQTHACYISLPNFWTFLNNNSFSALLTMPKPLTVWITINCRKFWKRWAYQTTLTCLLRNLYAGQEAVVRTGHETTDWLQIAKEVHQGIYCHPAYLTYMQSTSWEMLDWTGWSTSWNQDFQEKYQ